MFKKLLALYLSFVKIGACMIGGGYAMLPILQREVVDKRGWATEEQVMDIYAIGQCTPGIIAVNTATYIGHLQAGIVGGISATLGLITAPLTFILILAAFLSNFAEYEIVKDAFAGIRACVVVLIFSATIKLWKKSVQDIFAFVIFLAVLAAALFTEVSSILFVLAAALAGVLLALIRGKGAAKK